MEEMRRSDFSGDANRLLHKYIDTYVTKVNLFNQGFAGTLSNYNSVSFHLRWLRFDNGAWTAE